MTGRRRRRSGARPGAAARRLTPPLVAAAAETACLLEVQAPKPGNVYRGAALPGLTYRDFVISAEAVGAAFRLRARGPVGRLVLESVRATRRLVGTNTNLGIVLLLAPLACAALRARPAGLRARVRAVLGDLDRLDARDAYAAIRLARPGGLGRVPAEDVRRDPTTDLLACMRLAAGHDAVAREYATAYDATFRVALPRLARERRAGANVAQAIVAVHLHLMATFPDTLVARQHGAAAARRLSREADAVIAAGGTRTARGRRLLARLDRRLRAARPPLNPGATADIVTAALFAWLVSHRGRPRGRGGTRDAAPPTD
jgi:triphosphoribosyl-dephospho-CoA synthase